MILLALCCFCTAEDKQSKAKRELTQEERQTAYNVSVNRLNAMLKAPLTAQYAPIEEARFSTGTLNSIDVRLYVDAQNSFGAMLRQKFRCRVWPSRPKDEGMMRVSCLGD
jgi:hypothetical protein